MCGLIILPEYVDEIFTGSKKIEYRSFPTYYRGTIGIIKSKTKKVWGFVDIYDCVYSNSYDEYEWMLKNIQALKKPIPYIHPNGAIRWVNLDHIEDKIPDYIKITPLTKVKPDKKDKKKIKSDDKDRQLWH